MREILKISSVADWIKKKFKFKRTAHDDMNDFDKVVDDYFKCLIFLLPKGKKATRAEIDEKDGYIIHTDVGDFDLSDIPHSNGKFTECVMESSVLIGENNFSYPELSEALTKRLKEAGERENKVRN